MNHAVPAAPNKVGAISIPGHLTAPDAVGRPGRTDTDSAVRKRVLVLGASGFIGERLVAALAASDWAIPLAASRRGTTRSLGTDALQLDTRDAGAVRNALQGVDAVVNCVAGDNDAIIAGARVLFSCCAQLAPPPRVVHLSTMMVYGTATGTVDETAPLRGDWDDYSAAKVAAEGLARQCASVVILRPGIVYGPDSPIWTQRIGHWLLEGRLGELGPAGEGCCNLVHVDDVVAATCVALRLDAVAGEAFNLSLPSPPSWNAYFRQYASALDTPVRSVSRSRLQWERWVLAAPLKFAEILTRAAGLGWRPPAPIRPWLLRLCGHPLRLEVGKAERLLGMRWKPLDEGLRECAGSLRGCEAQAFGKALAPRRGRQP